MSENTKKPWYRNVTQAVVQIFSGPAAEVEEKVTMREAAGVTIDDDEDQWRPLTGDTKRDLSPVTQSRMREMAFYLWESNNLANRLIELPLAYILGEGVKLSSKDKNSQDVLDKFWKHPINNMDIKLVQKTRELALYGEQCYPAFVNSSNGVVQLGYLDPALIDKVMIDPANPEQPIGVITCKDARGVARKFKVIINGPEDIFTDITQKIRNTFTDGECFFFKVNNVSNGKRGRSDLLPQADWLDAYDEYMFNELERTKEQRSFIWDVELTGATPEEVKRRANEITPPGPSSVRVHNDAEKWKAESPDLKATDTSEIGRLFRNHILGGSTVPEHWFGGGGDVNRAVGAEMGEPTFKIFSMRQKFIKHMLEEIGRYVIRQHILASSKVEPEFNDERLDIDVVFPEMTAKDISKYATAIQQVVVGCSLAMDKKLMTEDTALKLIATIAERLGIEIDAAAELLAVQGAKDKEDDASNITTPDLDLAA